MAFLFDSTLVDCINMNDAPHDSEKIIIAIDAMGGDNAPHAQIKGAKDFLLRYDNVHFLIYGKAEIIKPLIDQEKILKENSEVIHSESVISGDAKPSIALRQGRKSSMRKAIDAVANGKAHGVVSAGNTGALMAMSKIALRMLPGVDRPAIIASFPTMLGQSVMLDLGANVECSADHLFQFAIIGNAFSRATLELESPTIALLNVGSEDLKGNDAVKLAAEMLKNSDLNFQGFVEGNGIIEGKVDVIVTDGFTGNIAIKTLEGTAKACKFFLKDALSSSILSRIGALMALPALKKFGKKVDPRKYNGAMFGGLNGVAVKSHGSADRVAFAQALKVAVNLVKYDVNGRITQEIKQFNEIQEADTKKISNEGI
jgi:glycerol-3-phosphate acyltransferase PlsX